MKNEDDELRELLQTLAAMAVDAIRASVLLTVLDNRTPYDSSGHVALLHEALDGLHHAAIPSSVPSTVDEAIARGVPEPSQVEPTTGRCRGLTS